MANVIKKGKRWAFGNVPYVFDKFDFNDSTKYVRQGIQDAIDEWNSHNLNVHIKEHTAEPYFLLFKINRFTSSGGSETGVFPGIQIVWAVDDSRERVKIMMLHELGHALGLYHEVCRHDRDDFVNIDHSNIQHIPLTNYYENQFDIEPLGEDSGNYDYLSIMHYGSYAYAKDPSKPVITKKIGGTISTPTALSTGDIEAIRALYKDINSLPFPNLILKALPSANTIFLPSISVDPPAIQVTPPPISITPPSVTVTPPSITVTPPSISVTPPSITVSPAPMNILGKNYYPPSINVQPDTIIINPPPISVQPDAITIDPPAITVNPPAITVDLPPIKVTPPPLYI